MKNPIKNPIVLTLTSLLLSAALLGCEPEAQKPAQESEPKEASNKPAQPATDATNTNTNSSAKPEVKPSFECSQASSSVEVMVCEDAKLAELDNQLAQVYAKAMAKSDNETLQNMLKAEQRGWVKGRNDCWKAQDKPKCVADNYQHRIAELQAQYGLVKSRGPFFFYCNDNRADEFVVTYFETEPQTASVERGDSSSLMFSVRTASGAKYQGRNEWFWEHQGEATFVWGFEAPELKCQLAKN